MMMRTSRTAVAVPLALALVLVCVLQGFPAGDASYVEPYTQCGQPINFVEASCNLDTGGQDCFNGECCFCGYYYGSQRNVGSAEELEGTDIIVEEPCCICEPGWEGDACGVLISVCEPNPCANGACVMVAPFVSACNCYAGWEGDACETEVDPCTPNPCLQEGTCSNKGGGVYGCSCSPDYTGDHCETCQTVDTDGDGTCDNDEIEGCLDNPEACNYDADATDVVACTYPDQYRLCNGACENDLNSNDVCDELEATPDGTTGATTGTTTDATSGTGTSTGVGNSGDGTGGAATTGDGGGGTTGTGGAATTGTGSVGGAATSGTAVATTGTGTGTGSGGGGTKDGDSEPASSSTVLGPVVAVVSVMGGACMCAGLMLLVGRRRTDAADKHAGRAAAGGDSSYVGVDWGSAETVGSSLSSLGSSMEPVGAASRSPSSASQIVPRPYQRAIPATGNNKDVYLPSL